MCFGAYFFVDMKNLTVGTDDISPTERNRSFVGNHAVGTGGFFLRIAEDGIVEFKRIGVSLISFCSITTGGKKGDIEFVQSRSFFTGRYVKGSVT
tara:strand:+ start:148 stop:432 length:285 start_codon:yes stop_codon:yes gene_type:complete